MRRIHSPVLLGNIEDARARAFVILFTCDAFARAILISLVPLQAYELLGAAQLVSVLYFAATLFPASDYAWDLGVRARYVLTASTFWIWLVTGIAGSELALHRRET